MTDKEQANVGMPHGFSDMTRQPSEDTQSAQRPDDIPCEDRNLEGHNQWNCNRCLQRLDDDCDEVLHGSMLTYQGWTEQQVNALDSFRQFDKTPWADLVPDESLPENVQIRTWALNCVKELQARMDAAREFHDITTTQHHLKNEGKASRTTSSTDKVECKDDNGNELHPQWTCDDCLTRLNDHFDVLLHEAMLDQGWTEVQIDGVSSLRQFDTKSWGEMVPDSSLSQLAQVRAWGSTRLDELQARMTNTRKFHEARNMNDKVDNEM